MATTDALGTAMKMLGVAAEVYLGNWDGSKYVNQPEPRTSTADATAAVKKLADDHAELLKETAKEGTEALKKVWKDMGARPQKALLSVYGEKWWTDLKAIAAERGTA